jgi:hypothetical protein
MSQRGITIQKICDWFRQAGLDESRVARTLVDEIVDGRMEENAHVALRTQVSRGPVKTRRKKHAGEPAPHASTAAATPVDPTEATVAS